MSDINLILLIAERAYRLARSYGRNDQRLFIAADIKLCHDHVMALDLERLYRADDANFAHDVFGIRRHLDRVKLQMTECFVARYARK